MKKRVYVNRHVIAANKRHGKNDPPITVATYKSIIRTRQVRFTQPVDLVYQPDKPLKCGATVWLETEHDFTYQDPDHPHLWWNT